MMSSNQVCLALSGGVGGARLASGLAALLPPAQLAVLCNTADDFEHLGLSICPDLDTVLYTLSGRANPEQGWGLTDESWQVMHALEAIGGEAWFRLGDRDIATHLYRTGRRQAGATLTDIVRELSGRLGVRHPVWPMSDDPVRTMVRIDGGTELAFQHYFVRERCEPPVQGFRFEGVEAARPQAHMTALLQAATIGAIVICPSNPFVSVDPILALPGVRAMVRAAAAPVVAVSPIVGGRAIKGPAAKMMSELGLPVSSRAVAAHYGELLDGFIIDHTDADQAAAIEADGTPVLVTQTIMRGQAERESLARDVLAFAHRLAP